MLFPAPRLLDRVKPGAGAVTDVVRSTYKRLEELRKRDPKIPQKPDYPEAEASKRPSKLQIRRTTAPTGAAIYKRRSQKQLDEETIQELIAGDDLVKEGIQKMIRETLELKKSATTAQPVMNRPASPNTSANKHLPRNPLGSKIQKWETDKQTCVFTLLRSGGEVKKISREQAFGLSLEICRISLIFHLAGMMKIQMPLTLNYNLKVK
ncbi:hypothetical protein Hanom_Chr06g00491961 [Helianthus anomalus]